MPHHANFHRNRSYGCRDTRSDFTVFKMAAVCHLRFVKFKFLNGHQRTKFRKDRSNRCGYIAIFVIFKDGGRCHLGFSKIQNFND